MTSRLEARLRKLEVTQQRNLPQSSTVILATTHEDAEHQITRLLDMGQHRSGWPLIIITGRQEPTHA